MPTADVGVESTTCPIYFNVYHLIEVERLYRNSLKRTQTNLNHIKSKQSHERKLRMGVESKNQNRRTLPAVS